MSYGDALKVLTTPPPAAQGDRADDHPRARRARQIDALLRSQGITGSYLAATRRSPLLDPRGVRRAAGNDHRSRASCSRRPTSCASRSASARWSPTSSRRSGSASRRSTSATPAARHLTPYDVLIVASMVEAEAQTAHDRPLVASVIYNRLAARDAARRSTPRSATRSTTTRRRSPSRSCARPRRTTRYIHKGLPPTPIDNPGLASIQAAAHPAQHELPVLRGQAVRQRRAGVRVDTTPSSWPTQRSYQAARTQARRTLAGELLRR